MRELALHLLDLVENSLRAEATIVAIDLAADPAADRLTITLDDNGTGLRGVSFAEALDPFYTTKQGKRTGLGLSLFKAAAEAADGELHLAPSLLAAPQRPGLRVQATMRLTHLDRRPLGDLPGTLAGLACTHPQVEFRISLRQGGRTCAVNTQTLAQDAGGNGRGALLVAQTLQTRLAAALADSVWQKEL